MWLRLVAGFLLGFALAAPGQTQAPSTIRVAVAANMRDAFQEISVRFMAQHPGVRVEPVFAASGSAHQQIIQGAPFDLFLSADADFPNALERRGLAEPGTRSVYARGKLGLWISRRLSGQQPRSLQTLAQRSVRRIAIANPEIAPYGRAAMQTLRAAGLSQQAGPKLVFGQDVGQTAQMALAAADAAFLPVSYLRTPAFRNTGHIVPIDPNGYEPLDQAYLIVRGRARPEVRDLHAFMQTPTARAVLRRYGYEVP